MNALRKRLLMLQAEQERNAEWLRKHKGSLELIADGHELHSMILNGGAAQRQTLTAAAIRFCIGTLDMQEAETLIAG